MSINIRHDTSDISTSTGTKPSIGGVAFNSMVPLAGHFTNGSMSVTTAAATATFTADEVVLKTALGGDIYLLHGYSQAVNLATTGAGGMDTGTAPVSGYVALYAIYNPTTATASILATNATAAAAPTIYGGANMPAGYTASALISVWPTNASSQFVVGTQKNRSISFVAKQVLSTSTSQASPISLSIATAVPKNAVACSGYINLAGTASGGIILTLGCDVNLVGAQIMNGYATSTTGISGNFITLLETPQTIYYQCSVAGAGTPTYQILLSGYSF